MSAISGVTQRNMSRTVMSKIMVTAQSSQATRMTATPSWPKALVRKPASVLPTYPPPIPSWAAWSRISGGMIDCMMVSSQRNKSTNPVNRSSVSRGSFSMRRRTSQNPMTIKPAGRMYTPQPIAWVKKVIRVPVKLLRWAENRIRAMASPTSTMTRPMTSSLRSSVREFHQPTEGAAGGGAWDFFFCEAGLLLPRPEGAGAAFPEGFPLDFGGEEGVLSGML